MATIIRRPRRIEARSTPEWRSKTKRSLRQSVRSTIIIDSDSESDADYNRTNVLKSNKLDTSESDTDSISPPRVTIRLKPKQYIVISSDSEIEEAKSPQNRSILIADNEDQLPSAPRKYALRPSGVTISPSKVQLVAARAPPVSPCKLKSPQSALELRNKGQLIPEIQSKIADYPPTGWTKTFQNEAVVFSGSEDDNLFVKPNQPPCTPRKCALRPNGATISPSKVPSEVAMTPVTPRKSKSPQSALELHTISPVTPEKQKKLADYPPSDSDENCATPPKTPSTLLSNLSLNSPNVERQNRRNLFKENIYQSAKKALHGSLPVEMPGREIELEKLQQFITDNLSSKSSASMYISGPPGTGKTAALNFILDQNDLHTELKKIYINCTAIKSSGAIYAKIVKGLAIKDAGKTEKANCTAIEKYLQRNHKMILVVLDEIDQLSYCKNQSILYTIFEWPAKPNSKLILIGIANALDLTDRILPRLQVRCELKPELMHFAPYSKQQIVEIFTARLKTAGVLDVFSPVALQMLAGKVAAVSGDVRRALDIGRRVIELVDKNRNGDVLKSVENLANEIVEGEMKPKNVDLKQVVNVLNSVYGTSENLAESSEDSFPLQQKIIVCTLLLILKKARNKDVTVGKLHEIYRKVCSKRNLSGVDQGEFVGLCSLIESKGIIRVIKRKEMRLSKVHLEWDEEEVASILKDQQLISSILQDVSCLGKM